MADEVGISWFDKGSIMSPPIDGFLVTPSDTVNFITSGTSNPIVRKLYVGTAGTSMVVVSARNNLVTFVNVTTGFQLEMQIKRVNATGTNVSGIVAMY